jgi:arylsulfatase A-like enzyme
MASSPARRDAPRVDARTNDARCAPARGDGIGGSRSRRCAAMRVCSHAVAASLPRARCQRRPAAAAATALAAAFAVVVGAARAQTPPGPVPPMPPNIVHIVADDIAWDDLGCFGSKDIATPNLDRLAAQGLRLTSFYAPHATCTPTRAAILTGGYAQRVSLPRVLFPTDRTGLAADEVTIAELLRDHGYATACIGKWHLGHRSEHLPTRHGFDAFFGIPYPNDHGPERLDPQGRSRGFPPLPLLRGDQVVEQPAQLATLPERFVAEAVGWIAANKARPFFLHFANIETHTPWLVARRFQGQSKAGVYGDAVQCLDWAVGELLAALAAAGVAERTLVVFHGDNGPLTRAYPELEGIYGHAATVDTGRAHALRGEKYSSRHEGGVRVPAIVRWPGAIAPGRIDDGVAAGFDLYHTFAAAAGVPVPPSPPRDGIALLDRWCKDAPPAAERLLAFYDGWQPVAARRGRWKLVLANKPDAPPTLYDLDADRGETQDLAAQHPAVVAALRAGLDALAARLGRGAPGPDARPAHTLPQ